MAGVQLLESAPQERTVRGRPADRLDAGDSVSHHPTGAADADRSPRDPGRRVAWPRLVRALPPHHLLVAREFNVAVRHPAVSPPALLDPHPPGDSVTGYELTFSRVPSRAERS